MARNGSAWNGRVDDGTAGACRNREAASALTQRRLLSMVRRATAVQLPSFLLLFSLFERVIVSNLEKIQADPSHLFRLE
jgi:hypothetical protein